MPSKPRDARPARGRPRVHLWGFVWGFAAASLFVTPFAARRARADADAVVGAEAPDDRAARDTATLAARAELLRDQSATARAQTRWRVQALYRLVVASPDLPPATRARAATAGGRAISRDVAEARALDAEAARVRAERDAFEAAAAGEPPVGGRPRLAPPVGGVVLARFGAATDVATGLSLSRAGVRLAARGGEPARAPGGGRVARVAAEPSGRAVVIDHGAGWTTIVGGLAEVTVAPGDLVAAGQPVGVAAGPPSAVTFEVWRGRRPVDPFLPQLLARPHVVASSSTVPLTAAPPLAAPGALP